jgi:serine phosphatase RsbU (regulator of sigma subunit)
MVKKEIFLNRTLIERLNNDEEIDHNQLKNQFVSLFHYNDELTSSLKYAEIIQKGVLPKDRHFKRLIQDYFVMYIPQSYVSGDFYWIGEVNDNVLFAVGDCTGHGVPGAMLTMLAQSFLNHIILGKKVTCTSEILKEFDKKFIETFQDDFENDFHNDWIDIALCCYNRKTKMIQYSGAKRKMLLVSKEESEVFKGSNYPVGGWQIENERIFESQSFQAKEGDVIYLGSDGFQDQIGGENDKKYGSKRLHQLLIDISGLPCEKQLMILKRTFKKWKQDESQLDDICLMGIRI